MSSISSILRRSGSTSALRSLNARNRASYSRGRYSRSGSVYKTRRSYFSLPRYARKSTRTYNRRKMKSSYSRYYRKRRYRQRGFAYTDSKIKLLKQGSESWLEYYKDQDKSPIVFENLVAWASWRSPRKIVDGIASLVAGRPYVKFVSLSDNDKSLCTQMYSVLSSKIAQKRALFMTPGYYQAQQIYKQASREALREQVRDAVAKSVTDQLKHISQAVPDMKASDSYNGLKVILDQYKLFKRTAAAEADASDMQGQMHASEL